MSIRDGEDTRACVVLVNHEERHSLGLQGKEVPAGWSGVGEPGSKEACLAHAREGWTDMRPLSLRGRPEAGRAS